MTTTLEMQPRTKQVPVPWQHQENALTFSEDKSGVMLAMEMGTGKDLDDETPIPTPDGWTKMGNLRPGDVVFDEQGTPCTVTAVFPQGQKTVYEVEFDDGTKLMAGAEHQWLTLTHSDRAKIHKGTRQLENWGKGKVPVTTLEVRDTLVHHRKTLVESMHSIPTAQALDLPERELPIDPYILGLRLGDGHQRDPAISCHVDDEPHYAVAAQAPGENWRVRSRQDNTFCVTMAGEPAPKMRTRLVAHELWGRKHIPQEYLRASREQRLALLRGLMDTDGHTGRQGDAEFASTSRELADGTLELALSLGQKATVSEGRATLKGVDISAKYRVRFTPTLNVFSLPRKAAHLEKFLNKREGTALPRQRQRYIRRVTEAGVRTTTCITVDSGSSLFLAGREMIPTHNTKCAVEYIYRTGAKRTLVLAPLSIVDHVWEDQITIHSPIAMTVVALGQKLTGTDRKIKAAESAMIQTGKKPLVVIVNYETTIQPKFRQWAEKMKWDLLILDESHRIKAPTGKTSLWIGQFARKIPRKMALTGTPMPHSPLDIYAQYRALDQSVFGDSFHAFRDRYAVLEPVKPRHDMTPAQKKKLQNAKQVVGHKNLPELTERMSKIAFQVRSQDVQDLPPYHHFTYRIGLDPKAEKAYRQMEKAFMAQLESGDVIHADNGLVQLLKLQQMTSGYYRADDKLVRMDRSKSKALEEILDAINISEPVVVFGRFLEDLQEVKETAESAGRTGFEYSGRMKQLNEWKEQNSKENEPGGVLAAQIQTGSVGVDMTQSRYCIYYSLGFSYGDYEQSLKRVHREGQHRTVRYIHLIAADTVDEKVYDSLQRKEDIVRSIMDSKSLRP